MKTFLGILTTVLVALALSVFNRPANAINVEIVEFQADSITYEVTWTNSTSTDVTHHIARIWESYNIVAPDVVMPGNSAQITIPWRTAAYQANACVRAYDDIGQPSGEPCLAFTVPAQNPPPASPTNIQVNMVN